MTCRPCFPAPNFISALVGNNQNNFYAPNQDADGEEYSGYYKMDKRHGKGRYKDKAGRTYKEVYENGESL